MLNPERILIVEVNWLGDVLFSTAAIDIIRKNFPNSYIACLVVPRVKEILEDNPDINELIIFDENKLRLIFTLRKKHFDIVFLFHRSFTRLFLCFLAGIKKRIGYYTKKRSLLLTQKIMPPDINSMHRALYYVELLRRAGLIVEDIPHAKFFIKQTDRDYVDKLLRNCDVNEGEKFIVLNAGGNWLSKRWPKEYFTELTRRIIKELGIKVVFSGSDKDIELVNEITSGLDDKKIINLCAKTNLKQLAAIFEKAAAVVSADSGPMHIANCVGAKVIAIFGPTLATITGPFGRGYYNIAIKEVGCVIPCYEQNCSDNRCMKEVSVEEVFNQLKRILSQ